MSLEFDQAIIDTLSFFQIFNQPLTLLELWNFLFSSKKATLIHLKQNLENLKLTKLISEDNGFYSLNNSTLYHKRMRKSKISEKKYKKAIQIIKILSFLPQIKMIAVCNSLAFNCSDEASDIDLFIITKKNKIWSARFLVIGILKLLHLRPEPKNSCDKICASFFISEDNLNLKEIQFNNTLDIYLIYWIATLVPIYNKNKIYAKFIEENQWIKNYIPNWQSRNDNSERTIYHKKTFLTYIFSCLNFIIPEKLAKKIQIRIMPTHLKNIANKDTSVIITDTMLKFHNKDRRAEYYKKWEGIKKKLN